MLLAIILAVLAATAPSVADRTSIERWLVDTYAPYQGGGQIPASWDFPIYTAEVTALIAEWRAVTPQDEPDALSDGDWLCQCQDWDEEAFTATITSIGMTDADTAVVGVTVDLGFAGTESLRPERLILKRDGGAWKIDDMFAESFPSGLRQALRETIAEDKALRGERG
jgi:hypothetical protein